MTTFKPRIFIGSSKEGKAIAEQIEIELSSIGDCKIWYKQFNFGNSAYEDLVEQLSLYDYGILVGSADDKTYSRDSTSASPRDNIVFEFGLFAGRLGRTRSFLVAENGIKIPSDLNGITLPFFPSSRTKGLLGFFSSADEALKKQKEKITECCNKIKEHIERRHTIFDFGFLPSTALAYGYFNNFILKSVTSLIETQKLKLGNTCGYPKQCQKEESGGKANSILDGITFKDLVFTILIPDNLSADMFHKVTATRIKKNWQMVKIEAGGSRPFDFFIEADKSSTGTLQLSDIPLTLNALNESVKAYVAKSYIGISDAERLLEARELRIFKSVLDYLISTNAITKDRVKTELVDI
jgi:hypothetical protein